VGASAAGAEATNGYPWSWKCS